VQIFILLLGEAEVSDSDLVLLGCQEDVLGLQVTMQDALLVDLVQGKAELDQESHDGSLGEGSIVLAPCSEHGLKIATLTVLHDDIYLVLA